MLIYLFIFFPQSQRATRGPAAVGCQPLLETKTFFFLTIHFFLINRCFFRAARLLDSMLAVWGLHCGWVASLSPGHRRTNSPCTASLSLTCNSQSNAHVVGRKWEHLARTQVEHAHLGLEPTTCHRQRCPRIWQWNLTAGVYIDWGELKDFVSLLSDERTLF